MCRSIVWMPLFRTGSTMTPGTTTVMRYDGPAVVDHSMDARDLAPALSALSNLVDAANQELYPKQAPAKLFVRALPEPACFEMQMEIMQFALRQASELFSDESLPRAMEIAIALGLMGTGGLFKLYKWLAREAVPQDAVRIRREGSTVNLVNAQNSENLTVNIHTYNLAKTPHVAARVKKVVRPLTRPGYDRLEFQSGDKVVDVISAQEAHEMCASKLKIPNPGGTIETSTVRTTVTVKKPDLIGGSTWSVVSDHAMNVKIEDREWLRRFHAAEIPLSAGSCLDVDLRSEIRLDAIGDPVGEPKYYVLKVHAVVPPSTLLG